MGHWDYAAVSMREGDQCVWWKRACGGLALALKSGVQGRRHPPPAVRPDSPGKRLTCIIIPRNLAVPRGREVASGWHGPVY